MGLSFDSISSTGANAAVVHYKPPKEGSKIVAREDIYLIDSGGQYLYNSSPYR
jgi:Xaa-Pro aminopeptidase